MYFIYIFYKSNTIYLNLLQYNIENENKKKYYLRRL